MTVPSLSLSASGTRCSQAVVNSVSDSSCKSLDMDGKSLFVILEPLAEPPFFSENSREVSGKTSHASSLAGPWLRESKDELLDRCFP